jgi:predicted deacylase
VADRGVQGPVVCLTACLHGDEVGGTAIVHDVFARLRRHGLLRGAVHAFPLVNSMGFENAARFIAADGEDLNRCFPGNPHGSLGEQIARRLFDTLLRSEPDLIIDLHNDWIRSVPYLLVDPPAACQTRAQYRRLLKLAGATGLLLVEDADTFHPLANTLAGAALGAGVPAFTIEAGGSLAVVEEGVATGTRAVLAVLAALDMVSEPGQAPVRASGQLCRYTDRPHASTSGLVRFAVAPGDSVSAGQRLATVFSAFGSPEESLHAVAPGIVLGLEDHARALPGRPVIALAELPDG